MKQAKFALTAVALLAVVSSALAYKASRVNRTFYKYTTSAVSGRFTGICDQNQTVVLQSIAVIIGGVLTTVSAAPAVDVTTCTARVVPGL